MNFSNSDIVYSPLLETVTSGIYDGNSNCIREYVQNAIDADAKIININHINNKSLEIRDNGFGMSANDLKDALKLGYNNKSEKNIGWRGIGIYSGIPNFEYIHINSRKRGTTKKIHITINCATLRASLMLNKPIYEALEEGIKDEIEETDDDSFEEGTQILLENSIINQEIYFKREELEHELITKLPLPLGGTNSELKDKIKKALKNEGIEEPSFQIIYNGQQLFRPPYDYSNFDSSSLEVKECKSGDGTKIFFIWVLTSLENKELEYPNKGLIFRKKNFAVGDERTTRKLFTGSYNYWNYGEIHILDNSIKENAGRNDFEIDSGHATELFKNVSRVIEELQKNNRKKSSYYRHKDIEKVERFISQGKQHEAKMLMQNTEKKLQKNVSGSSYFDQYSNKLDDVRQQTLNRLIELRQLLETYKTDDDNLKSKKIMNNLSPEFRKIGNSLLNQKTLPFNRTFLDDIKVKIQEKSSVYENDFPLLISSVFAMNEIDIIKVREKSKILVMDPDNLDKKSDNKYKNSVYRMTSELGYSLNFLYQMFVNGSKHSNDALINSFFNEGNKSEKLELLLDLQYTLEFYAKMIDLSIKNNKATSNEISESNNK